MAFKIDRGAVWEARNSARQIAGEEAKEIAQKAAKDARTIAKNAATEATEIAESAKENSQDISERVLPDIERRIMDAFEATIRGAVAQEHMPEKLQEVRDILRANRREKMNADGNTP